MTKSELIDDLCLKLQNLSKLEVELIVNTLFSKMTDALQKGNRVELRGFGTFEVRKRQARQGRNPKTGSVVYVENRCVPFFKVGKELREKLNEAVNQPQSALSDAEGKTPQKNSVAGSYL